MVIVRFMGDSVFLAKGYMQVHAANSASGVTGQFTAVLSRLLRRKTGCDSTICRRAAAFYRWWRPG
jgi:hypothetical protein